MTAPLHFHTIAELAPLIASGHLSSEDLTRACLAEIDAHDRALNAFITVLGASALDQARALDAEIAAGRCRGPLHGIPISLKDLIDQQGVPTTAASRVREGHVAGRDATVTARLRDAGAVLIGKTNLHEFAFGTTSDDTAFGAVRNPHDPSRSPGGSSGGSAAGHRRRHVRGVDWHRYGRLHTHSLGGVRRGRAQTHVGRGAVRRRGAAGPVARPCRPAGALGGRRLAALSRAPRPPDRRALAAAGAPVDQRVCGSGSPAATSTTCWTTRCGARFAASLAWLRQAGADRWTSSIPHAGGAPSVYLHTSLPEAAAGHAGPLAASPERYIEERAAAPRDGPLRARRRLRQGADGARRAPARGGRRARRLRRARAADAPDTRAARGRLDRRRGRHAAARAGDDAAD